MNFQSLKTMIDNLVQTYTCPSCQSGVDDTNIEVVGTAGSNINVEIECPNCKKHSIVRAQVFSLELPATTMNQEQIEGLQEKLQHAVNQKTLAKKDSIKDTHIVDLNKKIREPNCHISDLFSDKDSEKQGE